MTGVGKERPSLIGGLKERLHLIGPLYSHDAQRGQRAAILCGLRPLGMATAPAAVSHDGVYDVLLCVASACHGHMSS